MDPLIKPKRSVKFAHGKLTWLTLGLAVALQVGTARADVVVRDSSEGDDDFMARVLGHSSELAQKVVRSTDLTGGRVTLIGFVNAEDNSLVGHLLIETSPGRYEHVKFPSCEEEGGPPELLAVFFARTVKGGGRDLAVLCSWEARHAFLGLMPQYRPRATLYCSARGRSVQMPSAEAWLPENRVDAIIGEGFMPLVPTRGRGSARLPRFQSIASPAAPLAGRWRLV